MTEIEIKAHVKNVEALKTALDAAGEYSGFLIRRDFYYKVSGSSSYPARIREEEKNGEKHIFLTHKKKSLVQKNGEASEKNIENEAEISEKAKSVLEDFFCSSGVPLYLKKEKHIDSWKCLFDGFSVTAELSEVPPLGFFIELEILLDENADLQAENARNALFSLLEKIGADKKDLEERPYSALLKDLQ